MEKKYSVIADFSIIPVGHGETSVGRYVAEALNAVKKVKGVSFEVTPMGTVLEANTLEAVFEAVKAAHEAIIAKGILRVESNLRIDDRRDKPRTMKDKVEAVKKYMKSQV
ncbi:MAG: MTH1187 family thiamine-binding protein [Candidatus Bathyarchaeota archaeon]|nr:MTH1187 family thiamine-binding protein [Candidatus Bathyarchaeota archaeon]